jgi:hypothetical protein
MDFDGLIKSARSNGRINFANKIMSAYTQISIENPSFNREEILAEFAEEVLRLIVELVENNGE